MTLDQFVVISGLLDDSEIGKAVLLAYYFHEQDDIVEFSVTELCKWFVSLALARPNGSRLKTKLTSRNGFVRGAANGTYRLGAKKLNELRDRLGQHFENRDEVVSAGSVVPESVVQGVPGYIDRLVRQTNSAYEHAIFDGCAVLMRRLAEVLLILAYQELRIDAIISGADGNYVELSRIIDDAKQNTTLKLSRNSKKHLDRYRTLGNFSAHKIYYTCTRTDIAEALVEYRALVQELLAKSGLVK